MGIAVAILLLIATAALSAALIILLKPLLFRYALARPNVRSSHKEPTPQGAGIAVVAATLLGALPVIWLLAPHLPAEVTPKLLPFCGAVLALAVIGLVDDVAPVTPWLRLIGQTAAAIALYLALPDGAQALPFLPQVLEAAICIVGLVWFINLTNFMDGIDGMTVAGIVPMVAGVALLAWSERPPATSEAVLALALAAALIGFAPFNRPVALVFLGDVGSLAIGGMAGWLLLGVAASGKIAAALILASYYLADTGLTLLRRWRRGERLSHAHREHFYQRATARGWPVYDVTGRVWRLGLWLVALAVMAGTTDIVLLQLGALAVAGVLVADLMIDFETAPGAGQRSSAGPG